MFIKAQREFFTTGNSLKFTFRIAQLKKVLFLLQTNEKKIADALKKDLNKSEMESVATEILVVVDELKFIIKNLKKWMKPRKVSSVFPLCFPGKSFIHYEPYGSVLIIGPWNYPFMLILSPLIGAMCAGNCVVIKPSEIASHTEKLLLQLISENFPPEYISVATAGPDEMPALLNEKFDYIFFTGGTHIGKIVMQAAAKNLTPVTLELGGKSPCIVDDTVDLDYAARKIIFGKFMNSGQVCLSPDYLYVKQSCKNSLMEKLKKTLTDFYGKDPETSESYCRIINEKHFKRLLSLMKNGNIITGGNYNESTLYIAPTLIDNISWDDPIMQEEIFGPLLPILSYENEDDLISILKSKPKPLALYLFTKNKLFEQRILNEVSFGGGCINDCIMQVANFHLPFGGVGTSGMGAYHGKYSFETFSHRKSIFKRPWLIDISLAYPPYGSQKLLWLKRLMRW